MFSSSRKRAKLFRFQDNLKLSIKYCSTSFPIHEDIAQIHQWKVDRFTRQWSDHLMTPSAIQIHPSDSVAVLLDDARPGPVRLLGGGAGFLIAARETVPAGHKISLRSHGTGEAVIKFGVRIGRATAAIAVGDWIHLHNCASDVDERSGTLEPTTGAPTDTVYE